MVGVRAVYGGMGGSKLVEITRDTNCAHHVLGQWELKERKSCFWQQALLTHEPAEAKYFFVGQTQRAILGLNNASTWLSNPSALSEVTARAFLELGSHLVYMKRVNLFDRLVCQVRDCFDTPGGAHPVFPNGSRAQLCFSRRQSNETTLAYFQDVRSVVAELRKAEIKNQENEHKVRSYWKSSGSSVETVTYEGLTAFEYGDMDTSAGEWFRLLRSLGVVFHSVASVAAALESTGLANSRPPPGTHAHVVYNWMAVRDAVRATHDPGLIGMLRD